MEDEVMTKMWTTRRPLPQGKRPYCVMIKTSYITVSS